VVDVQNQSGPLIDPNVVAPAVKARPVDVRAAGPQSRRKPTAAELGPKEYCWGTGRRKTAVARVRLRPGTGKITVNGREVADYFPLPQDRQAVTAPLQATDRLGRYDVWVDVRGGGATGQSGAAKLGVARALVQAEPELFQTLRDQGYLTRDGRMKERKKYGQRGARRRFQWHPEAFFVTFSRRVSSEWVSTDAN